MLTIIIELNKYPNYLLNGKSISYTHTKTLDYKNVYSHFLIQDIEFFNFKLNSI